MGKQFSGSEDLFMVLHVWCLLAFYPLVHILTFCLIMYNYDIVAYTCTRSTLIHC